jgi:DnaJ-class molecular chaperone
MVKTNVKECIACNGRGEVLMQADDMWGNTTSYWETCYLCHGEGVLEEKLVTCVDCGTQFRTTIGDRCDSCLWDLMASHPVLID